MNEKGAEMANTGGFYQKKAPESMNASLMFKEPRVMNWIFASNHAHGLILLAKQLEIFLRGIADLAVITERAVQKIVANLEKRGVLKMEKSGMGNRYDIKMKIPLGHSLEAQNPIGGFTRVFIW